MHTPTGSWIGAPDMSILFEEKLSAKGICPNRHQFLSVTQDIGTICQRYGYSLPAHSETGIVKFLSHSIEKQHAILTSCRLFLDFCMIAENEGIKLRENNVRLTWWALKQFNLRPCSDLFNHLSDEHIIEIYNSDSIQVYRSFNLFQFLSYSVSDLFSHEWWELYTRETEVFDKMLSINDQLLNGTLTGVVKTNYPDHWVQESFSPLRLKATMRHSLFSPLLDQNKKTAGFLSAFKIIHSESMLKA